MKIFLSPINDFTPLAAGSTCNKLPTLTNVIEKDGISNNIYMKEAGTAIPTTPPVVSCTKTLKVSSNCESLVSISGCVYTITLDVTEDNTPNSLILNTINPDKAITPQDTVVCIYYSAALKLQV